MSDADTIIHVSVVDGTAEELQEVRDWFEDALDDYPGHGKIVVTDDNMNIQEYPALDDYADELADRIAERLE